MADNQPQRADYVRRIEDLLTDLGDLWTDLDDGDHLVTVGALTDAVMAVERAKQAYGQEARTDG
jgi:hypothetical protein